MTDAVTTDAATDAVTTDTTTDATTDAPKVEAKSDAKTAVYTQDQVDAILAATRKEAGERALTKAGVPDLEAQVKDLLERANAADAAAADAAKAAREAELKALAAEFKVDKELFEETSKTGDALRTHVEKLSKLKGDEPAPKRSYEAARQPAPKAETVSTNPTSIAARAAAAAAKLAGGNN